MKLKSESFKELIAMLVAANKIKNLADVARRTGYPKVVVMQYASGNSEVSKEFMDKFYAVFQKDLDEISESFDLGELNI